MVLIGLLSVLVLAALPAGDPGTGPKDGVEVRVTQKHLAVLCLDGSPVVAGTRTWRLSPGDHVLAVTMRNAPPSGVTTADPGVAAIRFSVEPSHRYEVEVRAPALSYSSRTWKKSEWAPVVRDRSTDRIVSGDPDWEAVACH
jgi:hypothetical protein